MAPAKNRTPAEQAKHDAWKAAEKLKKENLAYIIQLIEGAGDGGMVEVDAALIRRASTLKKQARASGGVVGKKAIVMGMFPEVGAVMDEADIFTEYKLGRLEMRHTTTDLIKHADPADRLWISFNPAEGVYTLEGTGADAPSGWTGYRPVKVEDIEIM